MSTRIAAFPNGPPSGASSAASEGGPALRIRGLRPAQARDVYKPSQLDVSLLGLTIVLGGQYFTWNAALAAGMIPATTAFVLMSGAYVVLLFSLAEIASVYPFSGGAYAVARVTLGFFGGFMVGAIDLVAFIVYVAASVLALTKMIVTGIPALLGLEPLVWLFVYASAALLQTRSHTTFWRANTILASASFVILLLFCLGSLPYCDIRKNTVAVMDITSRSEVDRPSMTVMVRVLPLCAWFYVGADAIVLVADHVNEPREIMPRAQRRCIVVLIVTALWTFFVTCALPPDMGLSSDSLAPLNYGFASFTSLSIVEATWLSVPASYATAFGFVWAYGRLFAALATSGLVPRWLAATIQQQARRNKSLSSRTALGTGSVLSFVVCLIAHYSKRRIQELTNLCIGLAFLSYIAQTLGYITLRRAASSGRGHALARSPYQSPFGVTGAYLSLIVWSVGFISVVGFQESDFVELAVILSLLAVLAVYYTVYAKHHQIFSADERDVVMAATGPFQANTRNGLGQQPAAAPAPPATLALGPAPPVKEISKSRAPTASDNDTSFNNRTSSGSIRMPQLVRAGSKLNNLVEEHPGLTDDMEEPYVANWPPQKPNQPPQPDHANSSSTTSTDRRTSTSSANPGSLRRAGSDGVLASSVMSTPEVAGPIPAPPSADRTSILSSGFGRSFLIRHGRLERLREETDRDLRSAMSGIWSERSQRWSRGRAG